MPSGTRTVEHEIRIEASPETVFAFFTDPERMVRWMGSEATLDPRPGGICRIDMSRDIGRAAVVGQFVEVVPYSSVAFTWGWEPDAFGVPAGSSLVEVSLVPEEPGTLLRLVHSELPEQAENFHRVGWRHYAARLAKAAPGGDPGTDDWLAPGVPGPGSAEETS